MLSLKRFLHPRHKTAVLSVAQRCLTKINAAFPTPEERAVLVVWEDGTSGTFPYVWLRDCAESLSKPSYLQELSLAVKPERCHVEKDGQELFIQWPPYRYSYYTSEWLRERLALAGGNGYFKPQLVTSWNRASLDLDSLTWEKDHILGCQKVREDAIRRFEAYGLLRVTNVGSKCSTKDILKKLGLGVNENYQMGEVSLCATWEVSSMCPEESAVPKLHTLRWRADGTRAFQLVDAFQVAFDYQNAFPELFEFAANTPVVYESDDRGKRAAHPIFTTESSGRFVKVVFNNTRRQRVPSRNMDLYYRALKVFHQFCYTPGRVCEVGLEAGQILLLDNHRVLCGHSAFASATSAELEQKCFHLTSAE